MDKPLDQLGERQRAVLDCLWDLDGATVHEVMNRLSEAGVALAYTTVLTTLQNLERAGWVNHTKSGKSYTYHAVQSRSEAKTLSLRAFIGRMFDGSSSLMFESLLKDKSLSIKEVRR